MFNYLFLVVFHRSGHGCLIDNHDDPYYNDYVRVQTSAGTAACRRGGGRGVGLFSPSTNHLGFCRSRLALRASPETGGPVAHKENIGGQWTPLGWMGFESPGVAPPLRGLVGHLGDCWNQQVGGGGGNKNGRLCQEGHHPDRGGPKGEDPIGSQRRGYGPEASGYPELAIRTPVSVDSTGQGRDAILKLG